MNWRLVTLLLLSIMVTQCRSSSPQVNGIRPVAPPTATPTSEPAEVTNSARTDNPSGIPVNVTGFPKEKLHQYEERLVTVRGKFSLHGVVGPFLVIPDGEIYIEPEGSFSWSKEYERVEGRQVTVTSVLHFRRFKTSNEQHPPDYFYFRAETTSIKLN